MNKNNEDLIELRGPSISFYVTKQAYNAIFGLEAETKEPEPETEDLALTIEFLEETIFSNDAEGYTDEIEATLPWLKAKLKALEAKK